MQILPAKEIKIQMLIKIKQKNQCLLQSKIFADDDSTHQHFYNPVRPYTILDITQFNDGSQKCIDYIEK